MCSCYLNKTAVFQKSVGTNISFLFFSRIRYYKIVEGDHIPFIVNRERVGVQSDLIYDSIFERCSKHAFRKNPTMPNHIV